MQNLKNSIRFISNWRLIKSDAVWISNLILVKKKFRITWIWETVRMLLWNIKIGNYEYMKIRSSHPEALLKKGVLKICNKFTTAHPNRNVISIKLLYSFIEILLRHGCSPLNLLHIFRTPSTKNTSGRLLFWKSK